jgi:heavy metal sensor kinase
VIHSVRARLTLWYVGVLGAVLLAFSAVVYGLVSRALHARVDESLEALVDVAYVSLQHDAEEGQSVIDAARSTVAELSNRQQALAIYDTALLPLAVRLIDDDTEPEPPLDDPIPHDEPRFFTTFESDDPDDGIRVAVRRLQIPLAERVYVVMASQSLEAVEDELESLRRILMWTIPAGLALAALGGWTLARRSLAPVVSMADQARRIGAEHPDRRLPVANPRDELGHLALTFNGLLDRLTESLSQQRQFMADASHELRTPLAAIRSAAGVTLQRERRDQQEYRDALAVVDEQSRRLARLVDDMFTLARADAGHAPLRPQLFYLDELIAEIARAGSQIGGRRGVTVIASPNGETAFVGDEELLRRMLTNLVDNAIRYSPDGAAVRIVTDRVDGVFRIAIHDQGPGIQADVQPHIFDRFYRGDRARTQAAPDEGAGLGLAIARWVAEAHGGSLTLQQSDAAGSTFLVTLKALDA